MSKLIWSKSQSRDRYTGRLGKQAMFVVTPWDEDAREGFKLNVLLPGYGGDALWPMESLESAQARSEDILDEWLKSAGLQIKPPRGKDRPVPPVVKRVEEFVAARQASGGLTPPYTDLKLADLKALCKLAKKSA